MQLNSTVGYHIPNDEVAKEIIVQSLKKDVTNYGICIMNQKKLRVYESMVEKAEDLYFISAYKYNEERRYDLYPNKLTIWKLPKHILMSWDKHMIERHPEKKIIIFPPNLAIMVWQLGQGIIPEPVQPQSTVGINDFGHVYKVPLPTGDEESFTIRDKACMALKVPRSEKEWLNTLIIEARLNERKDHEYLINTLVKAYYEYDRTTE